VCSIKGLTNTCPHRRRLLLLVVMLLIVTAILSRASLAFRTAQLARHSLPVTAESLLEYAVITSGGDFPAAQLLRSRVLLSMDRAEEAIGSWLTIQTPSECSCAEVTRLADEALNAKRIRFAQEVSQHTEQHCPDLRESCRVRAQVLFAAGNPVEAEQQAQHWTRLAPESPHAWAFRAECLRRLRRVTAAADSARQALRAQPPPDLEIRLHRMLAELYLSQSESRLAKRHAQWVLTTCGWLTLIG